MTMLRCERGTERFRSEEKSAGMRNQGRAFSRRGAGFGWLAKLLMIDAVKSNLAKTYNCGMEVFTIQINWKW